MKTTKSILITVILVFATLGFSFSNPVIPEDGPPTINKTIKVHILDAQQNKSLTVAIRNQISPRFLVLHNLGYFAFHVEFQNTDYYVYGLHKHWKTFFTHYDMHRLISEKKNDSNTN